MEATAVAATAAAAAVAAAMGRAATVEAAMGATWAARLVEQMAAHAAREPPPSRAQSPCCRSALRRGSTGKEERAAE